MGLEKDEPSSSSHVLNPPSRDFEDTPLLPSNTHFSSQGKTFATVFTAIVGVGVLGLPYTFKKTGWVMGCLVLFLVAFFTYYCMMLLVYCRRKLELNNKIPQISSFGDLGFVVCGPVGRFAVDVMIVLSQAGFCVSYTIFISNTLANTFNYYAPGDQIPKIFGISPKVVYMWSCFPFQLGLNSFPSLTHLAPLSIFADVVDIGAMGVVMVQDVLIYMKHAPSLVAFGDWSVALYGLGVAVYAFEGVGMILPIESEMKERKKFGKILGLSMAFISLMFGAFGTLGYFAFGEETNDIITTNLGRGLLTSFVQICLCINLFISFPLMMNPVYEVMERRFCEARYCLWVRFVMVLGVTLVALLVPNFADFLSLVGSSVCIVLGFVLPALFHSIVFKEELGFFGFASDVAIIAFGLSFAVTGTWSSLMEIFTVRSGT